jgi:hypothetical protein
MKSILQDKKECWVCKTTQGLHKHHIYFGTADRKKSEKYKCWCYLCGYHHNLSNAGVHFDKQLDTLLKRETQKKFEQLYGHDKFMQVFKRNYL